jgi:hypothetical protein
MRKNMTTNYKKAEISANVSFRSIINEQQLGAEDGVHILTAMLCEWQREAMFQSIVAEQQAENAKAANAKATPAEAEEI